jgi:ribosomal protein S17E
MIKTSEIKDLKNRDLSFTEILEKVDTDFHPAYNESVFIAGAYLETRKYDGSIPRGAYKKNTSAATNSTSTQKKHTNKASEYTREKGLSRANKRRKKNIISHVRANADELDVFITLDFGAVDYFNLVTGESKTNCEDELSRAELEKLKGIKDLNTCNNNHSEKLNEEDDHFRKRVVEVLTNKADTIRNEVAKYIENKYPKYRQITEFKREMPRRLNNLISNCDPNDLDEVKNELASLAKRIKENGSSYFEGSDFKYFGVTEIQKQTGHFHFHLVTNLKFIPQNQLQKLWNNGTVHISKIHKSSNLFYFNKDSNINKSESKLTQYMTKELEHTSKDSRLRGKQIIIKSNGLKKSHNITIKPFISYVKKYLRKLDVEPTWSYQTKSESEYGKDFQINLYELPGFGLFENIESLYQKVVEALLKLDKDEITRDDYYNAIYEVIHSLTNKKSS